MITKRLYYLEEPHEHEVLDKNSLFTIRSKSLIEGHDASQEDKEMNLLIKV